MERKTYPYESPTDPQTDEAVDDGSGPSVLSSHSGFSSNIMPALTPGMKLQNAQRNATFTDRAVDTLVGRQPLSPEYLRRPQPREYFTVFGALLPEVARHVPERNRRGFSWFFDPSTDIFSTIHRRLVVVKEGRDCCFCLPIVTYGERGIQKPGINLRAHAAVVVEGVGEPYEQNRKMIPDILQVILEDPVRSFPRKSLVNFEECYTVEHYIPVRLIGDLTRESKDVLRRLWLRVAETSPPAQTRQPPTLHSRPDSTRNNTARVRPGPSDIQRTQYERPRERTNEFRVRTDEYSERTRSHWQQQHPPPQQSEGPTGQIQQHHQQQPPTQPPPQLEFARSTDRVSEQQEGQAREPISDLAQESRRDKVEVKGPAAGNSAGEPTADTSATAGVCENPIVVPDTQPDGSDSDTSVGWMSASSVAPSAAQSTALSSVDENRNASLSLFQAFYGDEDVNSHLTEAFKKIPYQKVRKNLSRLLLRLSEELKVEKPAPAEIAARNFFKSEIPSLHQRLMKRYGPQEEVYQRLHDQQTEPKLMRRFVSNTDTDEARFISDTKSEDIDASSGSDADDADVPGYEAMRNFLVCGQPFNNFKARLAKFVHPSSDSTLQREFETHPTPDAAVVVPAPDGHSSSHAFTQIPCPPIEHTPSASLKHAESGINHGGKQWTEPQQTSEQHPSPVGSALAEKSSSEAPESPDLADDPTKQREALDIPNSSHTSRHRFSPLGTVIQLFKSQVEMLACLWRPQIPSGHVRVLWNCRCGKRIYADFRAANRAAAVGFAQQAAGPSNSHTVSLNESGSDASTRSSSNLRNTSSEDETPGTSLIPSEYDAEYDEPPNQQNPPGTPRYLLLCVNSGMHRINLANVDLTHCVENDHILFLRIKEEYEKLRGSKAKNVFVVPRTIQYIKFELVHRSKSGESLGNFERDSIPSKEEAYKAGYAFQPCPPDVGIYPVSPRIFMHSFREPGDHTGSLVFHRLPKKLWRELTCGNSQQSIPVGWGIYIVEGYNRKLMIRCFLGVLFPTLILAVLWCILKRDVQGGMGIGQYSVAIVALVVPLLVLDQSLDD